MNNPLDWLWPLVDAQQPLVAAHVIRSLPGGVHERLLELGFLMPAEDAHRVLCPVCGGHIEELVASDGPDGTPHFFVPCPEVLRAHVPPEARHQWAVNLERLVSALAATLGLTGRCLELSPGRLWRVGRTTWQGSLRDVMLARGLHWDDGQTIRGTIARGRRPIILVAQTKPPDNLWRGRVPPILVLSQVATLRDNGIEVDVMEIAAAIQDADARATASGMTAVGGEQLEQMIRRQVKAEEKSHLTDDIFVAAYRQHNSLRNAAAFLSQETGRDVSKDQVHRAVKRSGGVKAVCRTADSQSVRRTVASQRRDGRRIIPRSS